MEKKEKWNVRIFLLRCASRQQRDVGRDTFGSVVGVWVKT